MTGLLLILIVGVAVYFANRVGALERRLGALERPAEAPAVVTPAPKPAPVAPPPPPPAPAPRPVAQPRVRRFDWRRTLSAADLMGAKALAFAGGVVTMLGVVFFF